MARRQLSAPTPSDSPSSSAWVRDASRRVAGGNRVVSRQHIIAEARTMGLLDGKVAVVTGAGSGIGRGVALDRKSTRLNSSHSQISYAVFCLKKKKKQDI